jgi:glycosyltransferase involved in cell wall biosynthesis
LSKPLRVTAIGASGQLGGTERVLLDLAAHASDVNLDLRVVVPKDGPLIPALAQCGVPAAVVDAPASLLKSSQQPGHLWSVAPASVGLLQWAKRLRNHELVSGADVHYTIAFKPHLAAALGRFRPTVWHLHEFPPATTGWFWKSVAHRVPVALIANSDVVAEAWGPPAALPPGKLTTVHNGVDLNLFTPRQPTKWIHERLGIPHERRLVGMPAVLAGWKGQHQVAQAFHQIQDDCRDADLVFVGGTIYDTVAEEQYGKELERLVAGSARMHLLPFQEDIERAYPEFDVTVHYSLRPEPFGRVIVESMACGVPVIAADEGGPREILGDEAAGGWLVEPRKVSSLAAALRDALDQPQEVREARGRNGRKHVAEAFSSLRFAEGVASVLRTAVGHSGND